MTGATHIGNKGWLQLLLFKRGPVKARKPRMSLHAIHAGALPAASEPFLLVLFNQLTERSVSKSYITSKNGQGLSKHIPA